MKPKKIRKGAGERTILVNTADPNIRFCSILPENDPEKCAFHKIDSIKGLKMSPIQTVHFKTTELIRWAIKVLSHSETAALAPHQDLSFVKPMPKGASTRAAFGPQTAYMRMKLIAMEGRFGTPLHESARTFILNGQSIKVGSVTLSLSGESYAEGRWSFSHEAFSFAMACEFSAYILRDVATRTLEKKYYVPWLITRPAAHWLETRLSSNADEIREVPGWQAPSMFSLKADSNMDVEDTLRTDPSIQRRLDLTEGERPLNVKFLVPDSKAQDAVALDAQGQTLKFCLVTKQEEGMTSYSSSRLTYYGSDTELVYFSDWKTMVKTFAEIALRDPLQSFLIPVMPDPPKQKFAFWVGEEGAPLLKSEKQVRQELAVKFPPDPDYQGFAAQLKAGQKLAQPLIGEIRLDYRDYKGYFFSKSGENPDWTIEELVQAFCLVLADPLTEKVSDSRYLPFLLTLVRVWKEEVFKPQFAEQSEAVALNSTQESFTEPEVAQELPLEFQEFIAKELETLSAGASYTALSFGLS